MESKWFFVDFLKAKVESNTIRIFKRSQIINTRIFWYD